MSVNKGSLYKYCSAVYFSPVDVNVDNGTEILSYFVRRVCQGAI